MTGDVSRETHEKLNTYCELLKKWNLKINLIAPSTISDIWQRHIQDSLQIAEHTLPKAGVWADLGSGGGLPGIVLAVAFENTPAKFTLIESDGRKSVFLRTVTRSLCLKNVTIINDRIEAVPPLNADFISARALSPLTGLMPHLSRHLGPTGQAWLMKGARWKAELESVKENWAFNYRAIPSKTESQAVILQIDGIYHV